MKVFVYAVGAAVMLAVLSTWFVVERNHRYHDEQLARVLAAVDEVAAGREVANLVGARVERAKPSARYPFLRQRSANGRRLGGPDASAADKLLADAATEVERTDQPFARFLDNGMVIAARPAGGDTAVVVGSPSGPPEPYPWILVLTTAAGLLLALTRVGPLALLAIAAVAGVAMGPYAAGVAAAIALATVAARAPLARAGRSLVDNRVPYLYFLPAGTGMAILVITPFIFGCLLGFFDHSRGEWQFVGLSNFIDILSGGGRALDDPLNFYFTLAVTLAWTAVNVALHVGVGVALALALHQKWLRGRAVFRTLLILPWAIPSYITALIWRGMFAKQYGAVNELLGLAGIPPTSWFTHFAGAFTANVVTNAWLGFPFMMVVALGALDSIPKELYEAAAVDGAGAWARFRHITLPGLRPAMLPAIVLGSVWTFNMFNVIYLVSGGRPAGTTDILVTQAYRWAFERGQRYGMAAAYALVIFLLLLGWMALVRRAGRRAQAA